MRGICKADEARLDEIADDVSVFGDGSRMDGQNNLGTIIIQTLARLPVEVYNALNVSQILFVGPGPGHSARRSA